MNCKKIKTKILLVLFMIFGLFLTQATTASAVNDANFGFIHINGIRLGAGNYTDVLGDGKVTYDIETDTLTLNTVTRLEKINISANIDVTIELIGHNYIQYQDASGGGAALYIGDRSNVTIVGDGALQMTSNKTSAIIIEEHALLTIKDDTYIIADAHPTSASTPKHGIAGAGSLTIMEDAIVKANGNDVGVGGYGVQLRDGGISSYNPTITIKDNGRLEAWAGNGTGNTAGTGIESKFLVVEGGEIIGRSTTYEATSLGQYSGGHGLYIVSGITQTGGKITGISKANAGVFWHGGTDGYTMSGGEMEATTSGPSATSYRVQVDESAAVVKAGASKADAVIIEDVLSYQNYYFNNSYVHVSVPGTIESAPVLVTTFDELKAALENPNYVYVEIDSDSNLYLEATSAIDIEGKKILSFNSINQTIFNGTEGVTSLFNIEAGDEFDIIPSSSLVRGDIQFRTATNNAIMYNVTGGTLYIDMFSRMFAGETNNITMLNITGGQAIIGTDLSASYFTSGSGTTKTLSVLGGEVVVELEGSYYFYSASNESLYIDGGNITFNQMDERSEAIFYGIDIVGGQTIDDFITLPLRSTVIGDRTYISSQPSTRLRVGNVYLTYENATDMHGNDTVVFDIASNTLTLNNANIVSGKGIQLENSSSDLTIVLNGVNNILNVTGADNGIQHYSQSEDVKIIVKGDGELNIDASYYGILSHHDLIIEDSVTLNVTSTNESAIRAESLTLNDQATINATTTSTKDTNSALIGTELILNDDAQFTANAPNGNYAINNVGNSIIMMNGGTLTASAKNGTGAILFRPTLPNTSDHVVHAGVSASDYEVIAPEDYENSNYYVKDYVKIESSEKTLVDAILATPTTIRKTVYEDEYTAFEEVELFTIENIGNYQGVKNVTVNVTGDVDSFDIDTGMVNPTIAMNETTYFTIAPKVHLPVGTYIVSATVTSMAEDDSKEVISAYTPTYIFEVKAPIREIKLTPSSANANPEDYIGFTAIVDGETGRADELVWSLSQSDDQATRLGFGDESDRELYIGDYEQSGRSITVTASTPDGSVSAEATVYVNTSEVIKHNVTIENGTPSGVFADYAHLTIVANDPEEGMQFTHWSWDESGRYVEVGNKFSAVTNLLLEYDEPVSITLTANYRPIPEEIIDEVDITLNQNYQRKGSRFDYEANVIGPDAIENALIWTVTGNNSPETTIENDTGVLIVAKTETASQLIVTATSSQDTLRSDAIPVSLVHPSSIIAQIEAGDKATIGYSAKLIDAENNPVSVITSAIQAGYDYKLMVIRPSGSVAIPDGQYTLQVTTNNEGYRVPVNKEVIIYDGEGMNLIHENKVIIPTLGVSVSGQVSNYNPKIVTTVTLEDTTTGSIYETTIAASSEGSGQKTQSYRFENIPEGTYDLKINKQGHLEYTIEDVVVASSDLNLNENIHATINNKQMIAGDVNEDKQVNFDDLNLIVNSTNYNKLTSTSGVNANADITGDGQVNFDDLNVVVNSINYNKNTSNTTFIYIP